MSKTMMYLERFFIPNNNTLPINTLAIVLFHVHIINHFPEIEDEIVIEDEDERIHIQNLDINTLINNYIN